MRDEAGRFDDSDPTASLPDRSGQTRLINNYRLLRKLGEGGMGEVWEAEQLRPVQRRVALKLIKRGMDSAQVIARFETERQALALMNHPAIAKVFDAGTTEGGRPFFVMELVQGVPITAYCDRHRLSVRQRIELFTAVCAGVQHAHQKAIIHRDIKPSNILVSAREGRPMPKIIDFGVAKATAQRLTERTLFTELGQLIGTPEYMSPEQAELTGEDIDIRTDVYSLGMVLYELLAGALPFDPDQLRRAGLLELQRRIREDEPPKPSTRVTRLGDISQTAAQTRGTTSQALVKTLRGDLDWIVMKALDKDPGRRYETTNVFATDLGRYLDSQPVEARPPSTAYRTAKFVRRHTAGVAAVAVVVLLVLAFAVTTWFQSRRVARERDRAEAEAAKARAVVAFLQETLSSADPYEGRGRDVSVTEVLESAVSKIEEAFPEQPRTRAAVQQTIGVTYARLGRYEESEALLRSALEAHERTGHDDGPEHAALLADLAWVENARGDYETAETRYRKALDIRRRTLGDRHADVGATLSGLAEVVFSKGEYVDAESLFRRALDIHRKAHGLEHEAVAGAMNDLAITLTRQERLAEAEPLFRESLAIRRGLTGDRHPLVASSLNNLGMNLYRSGDLAGAEPLLREAWALNVELFGEQHPEVSTSMNNVALVLVEKGQYEEAARMFERVLELDRELLGDRHPYVAGTLRSLGDALTRAGRLETAEARLREAERIFRETYEEGHWRVADVRTLVAACLIAGDRLAEAEALLLASLPALRDQLGASHRRTRGCLRQLVRLYEAWGRPEAAETYRRLLAPAS